MVDSGGSRRPTAPRFSDLQAGRGAGPEGEDLAEAIVETIHEPLLVLSPDLRVQMANHAFLGHFDVTEEATVGKLVYDLGNGQWNIPDLKRLLEHILPEDKVFEDYQVTHTFEDLGERTMLVNARRLDHMQLILVGIRDVTESKQYETRLERFAQQLEEQVEERTRQVRELSQTLAVAEQRERRRLSQILHDDLQQLLYGIQMKVALAREHAERGDVTGVLHQTARSNELLEDAIARTRQLTVDLNPPILDGEGLTDAIEWLRTHMRDLHELAIDIHVRDQVEVKAADMRILLFQVVRELLFNVAKHARVDHASVTVEQDGERLKITVADDGVGFYPERARAEAGDCTGLGLFSARERLRMRGGDLTIQSAPGEGCQIVVYGPPGASGA